MSRLQVISFDTNYHFEPWFNRENPPNANLGQLKDKLTGIGELTWNKKAISFSSGSQYFTWRGNIKYKGDGIISGGKITSYERQLDRGYGHILVDGFSFNPKSESGIFSSLTLPSEITSLIDTQSQAATQLTAAQPGFQYQFTSPYG